MGTSGLDYTLVTILFDLLLYKKSLLLVQQAVKLLNNSDFIEK